MKWFLLLLLFPLTTLAQTIHFEDDTILYEGAVSLPGRSAKEIAVQFEPALAGLMNEEAIRTGTFPGQDKLVAKGDIILNSPFHLIRKVHFGLLLTAQHSGYSYRIDSVSFTEQRRGSKPKSKSSKELLEGMEETGAGGEANERLLNEIDMRFQKFLALLQAALTDRKNKVPAE